MSSEDRTDDVFLDGLRNAHAMGKPALSSMEPQVSCLMRYSDLSQRLQGHVSETGEQKDRLDRILERLGESGSSIRDTLLSTAGSMSALLKAADETART